MWQRRSRVTAPRLLCDVGAASAREHEVGADGDSQICGAACRRVLKTKQNTNLFSSGGYLLSSPSDGTNEHKSGPLSGLKW